MRVLHCADVQLDTPFTGLGAEAGEKRRAALRQTFQKVVDLAAELKVDALTVGGDLFDDRYTRPDTARFMAEQLGRLSFPVLISPGNHDYLHPSSPYATQKWPQNVHVFSSPEFTPFELGEMRVFGLAHSKPKGTGDLLSRFKVPDGPPAVALFHGSERYQIPHQAGEQEDHAPFSEADIAAAGFRFALLGHFHVPRVTDHLVYPGNPEPLSFGEKGERGAVEVDLEPEVPTVKVHPVNTYTLSEVELEVGDCGSSEALLAKAEAALPEGQDQGTRLRLVGELDLEVQPSPTKLLERLRQGGRSVEVVLATRPALDLEQLKQSPDVRGQFVRSMLEREDADSDLVQEALRAGLEALRGLQPAIL